VLESLTLRRLVLWLLGPFLAAAILLYGPAPALAAPAGLVSAFNGQVNIQRSGHAITVAKNTPVEAGDRIGTGAKSGVTITLKDGTQFELAENTSMILLRNQFNARGQRVLTRLDLLTGLVRSLVQLAPGNAPNYEVHTPNAVAGVRGTDFKTEYIENKPCPGFPTCLRYTDVGVYEGIVEVSNPTSPKPVAVRVTGGYETTVPCELAPAAPGPLGMGDLTAPGYH